MDELGRLLGQYRNAVPDPEASADFMPGMWRKIEARRSSVRTLRRFTEAFVTLAAALALLVGAVLIPQMQREAVYSATYVDVLAAEHSSDFENEVLQVPSSEGTVR
jgi:hypothetical protein